MGVVLLVRHGQASFGSADYDVLSETGWEQGRLLGAWLREPRGRADRRGPRRDAPAPGDRREAARLGEPASTPAGTSSTTWPWSRPYPDRPTGELDRREFQRAFELATARWTARRVRR